jgi:hypothetical protein
VLVYFSKAKQGHTIKKVEKGKWIWYIVISAGMKFRNKKEFQYGILAYISPF